MSLSKDLSRYDIERTASTSDPPNLPPDRHPNTTANVSFNVSPIEKRQQQVSINKLNSDSSAAGATESHITVADKGSHSRTPTSTPQTSRGDARGRSNTAGDSSATTKLPTWASMISRTKKRKNDTSKNILATNLLTDASLVDKSIEFNFKNLTDAIEEFPSYDRVSEEDPDLLWKYQMLEYDRRDNVGMEYRHHRLRQVDAILRERNSLKEKIEFLNTLPENPNSLKMEIFVKGQLSSRQMEILVRNKTREIVVPLRKEYADLQQQYFDLEIQYEQKPDDVDICARSILLIHKMRDVAMDIIVWTYIGNLKVLFNKAYFFQINTVTGLQVVSSNADIESHLYGITPELVKQEVIKRMTTHEFFTPDRSAHFSIEPTIDISSSYLIAHVSYEGSSCSERLYKLWFLQPGDVIKSWRVLDVVPKAGWFTAEVHVDLATDKVPPRSPFNSIRVANLVSGTKKFKHQYSTKTHHVPRSPDYEEVYTNPIDHDGAIVEKTLLMKPYTPVTFAMESKIIYCHRWCLYCRSTSHFYINCPIHMCATCGSPDHTDPKCPNVCQCGNGTRHSTQQCPHTDSMPQMVTRGQGRNNPKKTQTTTSSDGFIAVSNHRTKQTKEQNSNRVHESSVRSSVSGVNPFAALDTEETSPDVSSSNNTDLRPLQVSYPSSTIVSSSSAVKKGDAQTVAGTETAIINQTASQDHSKKSQVTSAVPFNSTKPSKIKKISHKSRSNITSSKSRTKTLSEKASIAVLDISTQMDSPSDSQGIEHMSGMKDVSENLVSFSDAVFPEQDSADDPDFVDQDDLGDHDSVEKDITDDPDPMAVDPSGSEVNSDHSPTDQASKDEDWVPSPDDVSVDSSPVDPDPNDAKERQSPSAGTDEIQGPPPQPDTANQQETPTKTLVYDRSPTAPDTRDSHQPSLQ